ncbi:MAG: hypothetical protein HC800_10340 [Phormidesmis sp. RL_2_1]|nr:hypothetical protein [Phormidesmis sp. RL_2_1]
MVSTIQAMAGQAAFGGGDGTLGYGGGGGGFGGAIFIRSGHLILNHTRFENNVALAANPLPTNTASPALATAQGKGGAIFIAPDIKLPNIKLPDIKLPDINSDVSKDRKNLSPPSVSALSEPPPIFINNIASDSAQLWSDNNNVYGTIYFPSLSKRLVTE